MDADEKFKLGCVLIVDDEQCCAKPLARFFRGAFSVLAVSTVAEAIKILRTEQLIAGLVLDERLPDGTGLELLQWLRLRGKATPCLLITGYDLPLTADLAQMWAAVFERKPWTRDCLVRMSRHFAIAACVKDQVAVNALRLFADTHHLTSRETQALALAVADFTTDESMQTMNIASTRLKDLRQGVLDKSAHSSFSTLARDLRHGRLTTPALSNHPSSQ